MHDVFISYSTKNKNVADAVVANFEQHGIKCWYAPRDILPGEEWVSAIRDGLNIATIFVLIYIEESLHLNQFDSLQFLRHEKKYVLDNLLFLKQFYTYLIIKNHYLFLF